MTNAREKLREISALVPKARTGPGLDPKQFVPAFSIVNRLLANQLRNQLDEDGISVRLRRKRNGTQFFVRSEQLRLALASRDDFLEQNPDTSLHDLNRDFDAFFVMIPITAMAALATGLLSSMSRFTWLAVLVSGLTLTLAWEWRLRRYKLRYVGRWGISELFIVTTTVAVNLAVCLWVL